MTLETGLREPVRTPARGIQSNPDRAFYARPEVVQRIIDGCPCPKWKAIIALSRFAGLRCPWCAAQFPETPVWDSRAQCTTP
jgi:hypothetical protein